ncbi:class I SAM-dependent methyltransferase [Ktedonosporobacter rubrisoli]|uniref:Class I SAM-dependent methyltransferase n=1 Tax=Ktedonosporobacter rubrisoli TaxID=2509675 RepID=A0A4P6K137_KTERU|nr:class I SAM-dependent methyltransferase [Ktedonosporobacter rubrisoli]QBD81370.1 class I SAM-dependent methyltransferase [Ktedonosporobacter rubrisoli]
MDRLVWLNEKRRLCKMLIDTIFVKDYDKHWGQINRSHRSFLERFLELCPHECMILDAACGTGKYWPLLMSSGHPVVGIDQSEPMLLQAQAKYPSVHIEKLGLQELPYVEAFDGIICIDAMENVFPEDWPLVLQNFRRALKPGGYCYFTVEIIDPQEISQAFTTGLKQGLPIVKGEYAQQDDYHYYPSLERVRIWLHETQFVRLEEGEGDNYHHFIVRKA